MIFATKRYVAEVYPGKEVWNYVELADAAYGTAGKVVTACHSHWMHGVILIEFKIKFLTFSPIYKRTIVIWS